MQQNRDDATLRAAPGYREMPEHLLPRLDVRSACRRFVGAIGGFLWLVSIIP
jgi:hypothetical protein